MPQGVRKRALVVVRTYPVPDESGIESSCTAAITAEGEWLRIYPVPWRLLPDEQRFRKYDWVDFDLIKATSDQRLESYHLQQGGVKIISTASGRLADGEQRKSLCCPDFRTAFVALLRNGMPIKALPLG
jgi:hypothetical protein